MKETQIYKVKVYQRSATESAWDCWFHNKPTLVELVSLAANIRAIHQSESDNSSLHKRRAEKSNIVLEILSVAKDLPQLNDSAATKESADVTVEYAGVQIGKITLARQRAYDNRPSNHVESARFLGVAPYPYPVAKSEPSV